MDQPLGLAIGNSLEVVEAIETLKGNGPKDLMELCLALGSNMVLLAKKASSLEEAREMLMESITSGKALEKFKDLISAQGGDASYIDDTSKFEKAKYIVPVVSEKSGYVKRINAENIGIVAMELGAGRATKESVIDLAVGIVLNKKRGDYVEAGEALAYIHSNHEEKIEKAKNDIIKNYELVSEYKDDIPLIFDVIK